MNIMNQETYFLLVDDDASIRRLLKRMLVGYPVSWVEADSLAGGMTQLRGEKTIQAAWVDVQLPDGSGLLLAEAARTLRAEMPVVLLSGARLESSALGLDGADRTYILAKPFTRDTVTGLAEQVLRCLAAV